MDFRQLETFVEVAKLKSFSKAAQKLFITQPTVTNHIQSLEKELNTVLINRLGKTISLTEAGSILFTNAIHILNSCEQTKLDLASYEGKIQGHINIYSSSIPRNFLLPPIIKEFVKDYPHVSFSIGDKDSKKVIQAILDGETDFGILGASYDMANIDNIKLMGDDLVLLTPNNSNFPGENYSHLSIDVLTNNKLILREKGSATRGLIEKVLNKNNLYDQLNIFAYVEDTDTIKKMVALNLGLSFISKYAVCEELKSGKYKAFYVEGLNFKRNFYLAYHKNRQLSPLNNRFKSFVLDYVKTSLS